MRGLLLASVRLASGAPAAALRVAGLSMLERAAFVARDAGVTAAVVVAERPLHAALREAVTRADLGVELTFADPALDRDEVLRALGALTGSEPEPVAVLRADVVHTRHASPALRDGEPGEILVDEREEPIRGAEGLRLAAGPTWVGLAVLRADRVGDLLESLAQDPTRGDVLALDLEVGESRAQPVPVTGLPWQAVRGEAEARAAQRLLFASLIKPTDGWIARRLNRPLSARVTAVAMDLPVTPNHLSLLTLAVGMAGCAAIAWGDSYFLPLLGALVVQVASVLDGCDGELARLRYQTTHLGAWLDTLGHDLTGLAYIVAVTTNLARFGHSGLWTWLGVVASVCAVTAMGVTYTDLLAVGSGSAQDLPARAEPTGAATGLGKALGLVAHLSQRETMYAVFVGFALLGLLQGITLGLFAGAALTCSVLVKRRLETWRQAQVGPGGRE